MSDEHLILERADGFAVLTLNRPAKRNALTFAMRRALTAALATLAAADDVACVVLTGAAPDFCAGSSARRPASRRPTASPTKPRSSAAKS